MQQNMDLLKEEEELFIFACKNDTNYYDSIKKEKLEDIIHENRILCKTI